MNRRLGTDFSRSDVTNETSATTGHKQSQTKNSFHPWVPTVFDFVVVAFSRQNRRPEQVVRVPAAHDAQEIAGTRKTRSGLQTQNDMLRQTNPHGLATSMRVESHHVSRRRATIIARARKNTEFFQRNHNMQWLRQTQ